MNSFRPWLVDGGKSTMSNVRVHYLELCSVLCQISHLCSVHCTMYVLRFPGVLQLMCALYSVQDVGTGYCLLCTVLYTYSVFSFHM